MNFLRIRYVPLFNSILMVVLGLVWFLFRKKELEQEFGEEVISNLFFELGSISYTALTLWCHLLQVLVYGLYLYHDILEFKGKNPKSREKLKRYLDFVFYYILCGNSLSVTVAFWAFCYGIGAETVYSTIPETNTLIKPPIWLDHVLHSLNLVNAVLYAYENRTSPSYSVAVGLPLTLFHTFYVICVYLCNRITGLWIYPLFKTQEPYRFLMFLCFIVTSRYMAEIAYYLNAYYCNSKVKETNVDLKKNE